MSGSAGYDAIVDLTKFFNVKSIFIFTTNKKHEDWALKYSKVKIVALYFVELLESMKRFIGNQDFIFGFS